MRLKRTDAAERAAASAHFTRTSANTTSGTAGRQRKHAIRTTVPACGPHTALKATSAGT